MKLSAILAPMIAAGVPGEVILATVKAFEEERADLLEKRRESDRTRQTAKRSRESRDTSATSRERPLVRADDTPDLENKQTNKEDKKTRTPRDELAVVLDADRVDAVIEHRIKLRKPLTAYAARQLAASFTSCPDANAAADLMIESGWLKIKPDWIASRSRQNSHGPPPSKRMSPVEAYQSLHSEPFHEPSSAPGINGDVEFLRPDRPGLPAPGGNIRYRPREPDERSNH